jgi:PIN domain-containing protein
VRHLFIDTNVFLSFFHFAKDDLEELRKVSALLSKGEIRLHLPSQVIAEFWRNRDTKIADLLRRIRQTEPRIDYPRPFHSFEEHSHLRDLAKQVEPLHTAMMRKAEDAARRRTFPADDVIRELFERASVSVPTSADLEAARMRHDLGEPPGKRDSLGDAVNWVTVMRAVPDGHDLDLVSEDGDWQSPLAAGDFNSYLQDEWQERKNGKVFYYPQLSLFLKAHYPEIKFAVEADADLAIRELTNSGSFADTHAAIASLENITDFTPAQVKAIAAAYVANDQVHKIIHDKDVKRSIEKLLQNRRNDMDEANARAIEEFLTRSEDDVFWGIDRTQSRAADAEREM